MFNYADVFSEDGSVWLIRTVEPDQPQWFAGLRFLPLESEVFGQRTARVEFFFSAQTAALSAPGVRAGVKLLAQVHDVARRHGIKHISCSAFAGDAAAVNALETAGYRLRDTIVAYHVPITKLCTEDKESNSSCGDSIEEATVADVGRLEEIACACFTDRSQNVNRFNSDPDLRREQIGQLYSRFIRNAVIEHRADLILVQKQNGNPTGFMTFKLDRDHQGAINERLAKCVLNAIEPKLQGLGTAHKLFTRGCQWLAQRGVTVVENKTQLSNYRVIHISQKFGGKMAFAYHTLHITL